MRDESERDREREKEKERRRFKNKNKNKYKKEHLPCLLGMDEMICFKLLYCCARRS